MEILVKLNSKRVPANALLFSILISLIIGVLLSIFLGTALYYSFLSGQNKKFEQLERNLTSGVNFFLSTSSATLAFDTVKSIKPPVIDAATLLIQRKFWGTFDIGIIQSFSEKDTVRKIVLAAEKNDSLFKSALYIADEGRPILFAGKTIISGDCYLPKSGVKRAYIDGNYFTEKKLFGGDTLKSKSKVPQLDLARMKRISDLFKSAEWIYSEKVELAKDLPYEATERSFLKKSLVYYSKKELVLRRKNLSGNIIIISDSVIKVDEDNQLEDVILLSKKIIISSSTKGNFQAFAKDTLWVEPNTKLQYPTVFGVIENDGKDSKALLKIEKGCQIYGTIFLHVNGIDKTQAQIQSDESSIIYGKIHSDNYAEIRGSLYGNLTCQKIVVHTSSATYDNHLFNVNISPKLVSKYFIQSMIYTEHKKGSKIVKYLH